MFGKDFWKILRIIYIILRALIETQPPAGRPLEDLEERDHFQS